MNCAGLSRSTNSAIRTILTSFIVASISFIHLSHAASFDYILRESAKRNGLLPIDALRVETDSAVSVIGEDLFSSKLLSNSGDIACLDCHLDKFSSADGLPNAIGIGGIGDGVERAFSGGEVIPRNTLPLWGRGQKGFTTFFWDGKVEIVNGEIISQFGQSLPSDDPLVVSVHLPVVEIREMLIETPEISESKTETVTSAAQVFAILVENLKSGDPVLFDRLVSKLEKRPETVGFNDIAAFIAEFIRDKFSIRQTKFHTFMYEEGALTEDEMAGAMIFYGKGKCSVCHSGPYFSDFSYHSIPLPQIGFGKNGFGVDYGRYNVTHNPSDLYKFRTPPLYNVKHTGPYGHSGSVATLKEAITYHFDPLRYSNASELGARDRTEYYKKLVSANESLVLISSLSENEVDQLVKFLHTLSFD